MRLPIATGDFESKYGTFADEVDVEGCVPAMQKVQDLTPDFGDPTGNQELSLLEPTDGQLNTNIIYAPKKR